ncbi:formiminoglutamate deiminase [Tamaricihabitans halophyticus]|uniref:Formiminoglutamate deiminase n=1 Tax=Tamaricihabitans halophyticus TaxID=1262583 RepID=A0A4R2QQB9_9PSEU|nr:formimidoylglutamate deiminase [Tamaricihabitans halophyticus]TCP51932.1 formiminoglutamate deiminase [Tamaricihabitans halophyticus]
MTATAYWCARAWLPSGVAEGVRIEVSDGRITSVQPGTERAGADIALAGLTVPGMANSHSHAFHRALRGRTHAERGTFWTWRERMYALAERLDPDSYYRLARGVYAEMVLAGMTTVGEFHYLHHDRGGRRYAEPNAMSAALVAAADDAGIRITLLDTCYLAGGIGEPVNELQRRFSDGDAQGWAERLDTYRPAGAHVRLGAAIHSVRAVPRQQLPEVAGWASNAAAPLHVHLSEQPAENEACQRHYGRSPTELLDEEGALGPRTSAVHATHLSDMDISMLGGSGTCVCMCPTTERDLGDGIGPARRVHDAGAPLSLGSDSHAVIDPFEEARALELDERLGSQSRGQFSVLELRAAATNHASLGWPEAGQLAVGYAADLVTIAPDSVRTAGGEPDGVFFTASAADVRDVVVAGRRVVRDGAHEELGDVGVLLAESIGELWP